MCQQQGILLMLQQQVQPQAMDEARAQAQAPHVPLFPQGQSREKLPEPPTLWSDDVDEDKKITSKMFSIYWLKVQMCIALVEKG